MKKHTWQLIRGKVEMFCADHPLRLTTIIVVLISVIAIPFTFNYGFYDKDFLKGLLENVHVLIFDLIVVGIISLFFSSLGERQKTIKRYREEIEDFLGWEADEAKYRIVGNIKRLNRLGITNVKLTYAYLEGAKLGHARLEGADLGSANLKGADLTITNLEGADLAIAHLEGADLGYANLKGADLGYANLDGTKLGHAHLEGADLKYAFLEGANMMGTHLKGANLEGAYLKGAKLAIAHLEGANLGYAHLEGTDLKGAYLDNDTLFRDITYDNKTVWPEDFTPPYNLKTTHKSKSEAS